MTLRWAYRKKDPVAAQDSKACSVFSGVKEDGGGVCDRTCAEFFVDDDFVLL
jgi:hypothetical protein